MSKSTEIKNFYCLDTNPLVKHKLTLLRDKKTNCRDFREILEEITLILGTHAAFHLDYHEKKVETPVGSYQGIKLEPINILPILRAGIGMLSPLQRIFPDCKTGFIGIARNQTTLEAEQYYLNLPSIDTKETVIILDPMLATANTVIHTLGTLKEKGINNVIILCIVCSKYAKDKINSMYPEAILYCAALDEELNEKGYIVPGLGDAGDRIFNSAK